MGFFLWVMVLQGGHYTGPLMGARLAKKAAAREELAGGL
jgi:hypothetical protein